MNLKKLIILFLAVGFACISMFFIVQTYAKYVSSAEGSAEIGIARWNIKVNGESIKNKTDISAVLEPVFPGTSHIAENIIAPTAEGYFDINFDYSGADVSFKYNILASVSEESVVEDLVVTGYSIDDGAKVVFSDSETEIDRNISEQINYGGSNSTKKIRIYLIWDDSVESQTMDDAQDTASTKVEGGKALMDVKISFEQTT